MKQMHHESSLSSFKSVRAESQTLFDESFPRTPVQHGRPDLPSGLATCVPLQCLYVGLAWSSSYGGLYAAKLCYFTMHYYSINITRFAGNEINTIIFCYIKCYSCSHHYNRDLACHVAVTVCIYCCYCIYCIYCIYCC